MTVAFLQGMTLAFLIAAIIAAWVWISLTRGNDAPLSLEEIQDRIKAAGLRQHEG